MRLYPKPKVRYNSFRLNIYSPLYRDLDISFLRPGVAAQLGNGSANSYIPTGPRSCFFGSLAGLPRHVPLFADIGRGGLNFAGHAISTPFTGTVDLINQEYTLAVWVNTTQASAYIGVCAIYKSSSAPYGLLIENNSGQFRVIMGATIYENLGTINDGKWHALVAGSKKYGYGFYALDGQITNVSSVGDSAGNGVNVAWGSWGISSYLYNGNSADLMLWRRALGDDEIKAFSDPENVDLRVGGIPLILPPLRRYWPVAVVPTTPLPPTSRKTPRCLLFTVAGGVI